MIKHGSRLDNFFKNIDFEESTHKYTYDGIEVDKSATQIVSNFSDKFDADKMSKLVALKEGVTQEEILDRWNKIRDDSCTLGTDVHLFGEEYMFNRELEPKNGYEEAVVSFWKSVPFFIKPVKSELKMYHVKYGFCGTADIILYNPYESTFIIADYKTNKDLFKNYKGKTLLPPFEELLDSPYNKYQIQLSIYQLMFEQTGLEVSDRWIIWLKPDGTFEKYSTDNYTEELTNTLGK